MEKVLVTITGIADKNSGKYKVSIGDTVILEKEPTNPYDKDAVQVLLSGKTETVGYVANSDNTVQDSCKSATDIQKYFTSEIKAKIVDFTKVPFKSGRMSNAYIAELQIETKKNVNKGRESKMANVQEFRVKLTGSVSLYPNKFKVAEQLKKGQTPVVKLVNTGDKIVAYFDNGLCGYVDVRKQEGVSTYEEIKDIITDEKIAKVVSQSRQHYIATFSVGEEEVVSAGSSKNADEHIQRILDEGILTQSEIDERVTYMKNNKVTAKQMATLFSTYKLYTGDVAKKIPNPKTRYQDSQGLVKKSIAYINMKRNPLFEGDRGVGKNVLIETLAWLYNRPLYEFSMNSQHDNNSLLGGKTFDDVSSETAEESLSFFKSVSNVFKSGFGVKKIFSAKDTNDEDALAFMDVFKKFIGYFTGTKKLKYDPDIIVQAAEVGGFLVLDEFNTSFGHVNSLFNSLFDDRRRLHVPGYKTVHADENFIGFATQNRDYQGTFENNEATIDRFVPIIFPPLTSIEQVLMAKIPGISYDIVKRCQTLFAGIKKCVEDGEISERTISIRGFIDACLVTQQDIPLKDALIDNIANRATDSDERKTIKLMIEDIEG